MKKEFLRLQLQISQRQESLFLGPVEEKISILFLVQLMDVIDVQRKDSHTVSLWILDQVVDLLQLSQSMGNVELQKIAVLQEIL